MNILLHKAGLAPTVGPRGFSSKWVYATVPLQASDRDNKEARSRRLT